MIARSLLVLALLGSVACDSATANREPPPRPPVFVDRELVRYHMRRHLDDLRAVDRLVVAGDI